MSGPRWQFIEQSHEVRDAWLSAWARRGLSVISIGPDNRIEYIGPFTQYNWAEGSRAIEARRGAAKLRTAKYDYWMQSRQETERQLRIMLFQLGLDKQRAIEDN